MPYVTATTIAYAALATAVVGTGVAVYGQQQQAKAAESAADYNAEVQRNQAAQEGMAAAENMKRKARDNARVLAAQRAAIAASGFTAEGTPLAVLGDTALQLEKDILDLGFESDRRSRNLIAGANMSLWEGRTQASALRTSSYATGLSGVSSALTGYGQATGYLTPRSTSSGT